MNVVFLVTACLVLTAWSVTAEDEVGPSGPHRCSERVERLLAAMTVEEKVGQLNLVICGSLLAEDTTRVQLLQDLRGGRIGSFSYVPSFEERIVLQHEAVENSRLRIPLLFARDICVGYKTVFPVPLGQAASWDIETIEACERNAAFEATADGTCWTYAPMLDCSRDPRWGRCVEGAGEDPYLASRIAAARIRGFQGDDLSRPETMLACAKHFVGYGDVQAGRDYHSVDMSERRLREFHLPAFKAAVDAGAGAVMAAFTEVNGIPSTANSGILSGILRDEWGFTGLVVTDYQAIGELLQHGTAIDGPDAAVQAFNAGIDVDLDSHCFTKHLPGLVESGRVSTARLDRAVRNVLSAKEKLGLLDDPYRYLDEKRHKVLLSTGSNRDLAYRIGAESVVLLQNKNKALPLEKGARIALIGPLAEMKFDCSIWVPEKGKEEYPETVRECIENLDTCGEVVYAPGCNVDDGDRSGFGAALEAAESSDVVVMVMGETPSMSGEANSRSDIGLPGVQSELVRMLKRAGKPIVIVLMNGRPLALEEESDIADAILVTWHLGHNGSSVIADTLFGINTPQGKLPMTFPRSVGQIPIHYDMKRGGRPQDAYDEKGYRWCSRYIDAANSPLFPFGHGLSYTTFEYTNLTLSSESMLPGKTIELRFTLSNTGERDGTEVVQLYIRDLVASVTRPVKLLKGFKRVELKAGESKGVSFTIDEEMLSFYRRDMTWGTEPGEFEVFVGGTSDATASLRFTLSELAGTA